MLTLKELKQTYDNCHPDYEQLMNRTDITDKKLNKIKREILQPYLEEQKLNGLIIDIDRNISLLHINDKKIDF